MDLSQLFYQPNYNLSQKRPQLSQAPSTRSQYIDIPEAPVASEAPLLPSVFQDSFDFQPSQLFQHSSKDIQKNKNQQNFHDDKSIGSKISKIFKTPSITRVDSFHSFASITPLKSSVRHDTEVGSDEDLFDSRTDTLPVVSVKDKLFTPAPLILPAPSCDGFALKPVEELPVKYRTIFKAFPYFNIVQSKVFDDVFYTDKPLVVCAPTGSGKTVIFELAVVRLIMKMESVVVRGFKIVYMAPIKALCSERLQDWTDKFESFGLKCKELTGDTEIDNYYELQEVNVILTTPEKWDSMTRRWRDNKCIVQSVCLFLIDEIHVLNDNVRGATIEAVISRMKTVQVSLSHSNTEQPLPKLRFIAVSATIPNIEDIAEWMGENHQAATFYKMDESCRPVRLRKVVLGYPFDEQKGSGFHFDMSLSYKLGGIINTYSDGKPALVFCSTRKGTQQAADILAKDSRSTFIKDVKNRQILLKYSNLVKDAKLRDTLIKGIGVHHAGMDIQDRKYMEELFASSQLQVLVATSTLAMGVNLPAHLVILKATQHYNMGMLEEYSNTQVLQMIGRAGRPQFDTTATAVIMTKTQSKLKYESLLNGTQMIESSLHKHLIEHLNAEIVLQTISDMAIAMEWIRHTYLYIRVMKNPKHYGMPVGLTRDQTETKLQELCMRNLNQLAGIQMIKMNGDTFDIQSTEAGRLMARYCIAFETMKKFCGVTGEESISDLLGIVSGSEEFMEVQLRVNEKKTLNTLNKDKNRQTIRYQLQGKIKTKQMKVNCLIQAQLGCLLVQDFALQQDITRIFRAAQRLSRCLMEVLWIRDDYKAFLSAAQLCKAIKAKLWENSKHVAKQLERIGPALSTALVNAGITSFQKIEETNPRDLELIVNRHPPFGNQVRDSVTYLPKYELTMEQVSRYNSGTAEILLHLNIANQTSLLNKKTASLFHTCILLVANSDNKIIFRRKLMDSYLQKESGFTKKLDVQRAATGSELYIHLISQDWVGLDVETTYSPYYLGATRISNVPSKVDGSNQQQSGGRYTGVQTTSDGLRPCNHRCYNKSLCGHKCCNSMTEAKPKLPATPRIPMLSKPKTGSICNYISGLKNKLTMLPDTPSAKRIKISSINNKSINMDQFAYTPKRPETMVMSDEGYSTHETIDQFNSDGSSDEICKSTSTTPGRPQTSKFYDRDCTVMSSEAGDCGQGKQQEGLTKPQYNEWAQLDLYQKHREEYKEDAENSHQEDDYDFPELNVSNSYSPQVQTTNRSQYQMAEQYGNFGISSSLFPSKIPSPHRMDYHPQTHTDGTLSYSCIDDWDDDNANFQNSGDGLSSAFDTHRASLSFSVDKPRTSVLHGTPSSSTKKRKYPQHCDDDDVIEISEGELSLQDKTNSSTPHRFGQVVAWSNSQRKANESCPVTPNQQKNWVMFNQQGNEASPNGSKSEEDHWSGSDNELLMLDASTNNDRIRKTTDGKKSNPGAVLTSPRSDLDSFPQLVRPKTFLNNKNRYTGTSNSKPRQGGQANSYCSNFQSSCMQESVKNNNGKRDQSLLRKSQSNSGVQENSYSNNYRQKYIQSNGSSRGNLLTNSSSSGNFQTNSLGQGNIQTNSSRQGNIQTNSSSGGIVQGNSSSGGIVQGNSSSGGIVQGNSSSGGIVQGNSSSGGIVQGNSSSGGIVQGNSSSGGIVQGNSSSGGIVQGNSSSRGNVKNNIPTHENIHCNEHNHEHEGFQKSHPYKSSVQRSRLQNNVLKPVWELSQSKTQQLKMADCQSFPVSDQSNLCAISSDCQGLTTKPVPPPAFKTASFFTIDDQSISDSPQETFSSIFDGIF
ncbi:probable ATP-dependent DNA helicase HFM1 isoform X2 [Mizuhopecten yessoensis]|uniref:probable ATP-dependent DNA helicase HFM1 isoform X2 n=1 Tax=Mizuhopecten yessoensis TaxID=6573 RepID=UPI000B45B387|nr:probable ATP-dependent DNA helicase HFM1 isoform X2 [Mizuhopecten yessoensis]